MTPEELAAARPRLEGFADDAFAPLTVPQRALALAYVQGLLLDGQEPLRPVDAGPAANAAALQLFISSPSWAVEPVRARLAARAVAVVAPSAWVVDGSALGFALSAFAVSEVTSCPLDWRLLVPEDWDDTRAQDPQEAAAIRARRARAGLPADARHRPGWRLALEMLDELAGWGLRPPVVVAVADHDGSPELRAGLGARGIPWVSRVDGELTTPPGTSEVHHLVQLATIGPRMVGDAEELRTGAGLERFPGRTWTGWHRHLTLVTAARLFTTSLRDDLAGTLV